MPPYMERQDGQLEFRHKYDPEEWFFPGEELVDGGRHGCGRNEGGDGCL